MSMAEKGELHIKRWRISVSGIVQGVGFRPFVYRLARRLKLSGWVCNTSEGALVEVEGNESDLELFSQSLRKECPEIANIRDIEIEQLAPVGYSGFRIEHSSQTAETQIVVPADVATCEACLAEIFDKSNRRYKYAFTNCTNCGPRFSIIRQVPYDRQNTTMQFFEMCSDCKAEYENPSDRRFHAQPNACRKCGPHLTLDGQIMGDIEVIKTAAQLLRQGEILAIKGLGGYHLACDARNTEAVKRLRRRKGRAQKPFALMCADLPIVHRICQVDRISEKVLLSSERPIVLMPSRSQKDVSPEVAPGINTLGVMLPYTPLHHLLMAESPPILVMTSGNLSEEPIAYDDEEALCRLGHIADSFLAHDRPIHVACDDSVVRVYQGIPMVLRRARGYVPQPLELRVDTPNVLACGGDLKNTFCLTKGRLALVSHHLGDLDNVSTLERYRDVVDHFCRFLDVQPVIIAHDLHPDYRSSWFARSFDGLKQIGVQHHHAHVVSCMAENGVNSRVIGVAFDGTGYGLDGCIWGGEFMTADFSGFKRVAHLSYVPIPGGEASIHRPGRMALAYLWQAFGSEGANMALEIMDSLSEEEADITRIQIERGINCPPTSSMGRLFDAVAALLNLCSDVTYEGQAAMLLESIAEGPVDMVYPYSVEVSQLGSLQIDVRPTIRAIVRDLKQGHEFGRISSCFHSTVADMIVCVCQRIRGETGLNRVALSGGVFQNALLLAMAVDRLGKNGFEVLRHMKFPCNDGGISLGQALVAAAVAGKT